MPCIIQHVTRLDELALIANEQVANQPDIYLAHPRPSVLKDYFDPKLRKTVPVLRKFRQVKSALALKLRTYRGCNAYVSAIAALICPTMASVGTEQRCVMCAHQADTPTAAAP